MSNASFEIIAKVFELIPDKKGVSSKKMIQKYPPWPALTHQQVEAAVNYLLEKGLISKYVPLNQSGIYFEISLSELGKDVRKLDGGFNEFWRQNQAVSEVNYYLKVLEYLLPFEGNGKYYRVDGLLGEFLDNTERKNVINSLIEHKYVDLRLGTGITPFVRIVASFGSEGAIYSNGPNAEFRPHEISINQKGVDYIENKRQVKKNTYNINNSQNVNLLVDSHHSTVSQNVTNNYNTDEIGQIRELVSLIRSDLQSLSNNEFKDRIESELTRIEQEAKKPAPMKLIINSALNVVYALLIEITGAAYSPIILGKLQLLMTM